MPIDAPKPVAAFAPEKGHPLAHPDQVYFDWIISALQRRGYSQRGLATALGLDPASVTRMLKGKRRIKQDEIRKAADYLGLPPPSTLAKAEPLTNQSVVDPARPVRYVNVRGETAGGRWLEYEIGDNDYDQIPMVPSRFGVLEQFAYRVHGNSMDKSKILDGDYVICVPYHEARSAITPGDIVVVERRRAGLYERTCKMVEIDRAAVRLVANSTDPRHDEPIFVTGAPQEPGTEVEIVGLVVGRYSPI